MVNVRTINSMKESAVYINIFFSFSPPTVHMVETALSPGRNMPERSGSLTSYSTSGTGLQTSGPKSLFWRPRLSLERGHVEARID